MKRLLLLSIMACASMHAATITLADGELNEATSRDGAQSSRIWNLGGGVTMTVTAFSLTGSTIGGASTTQFGSGLVGEVAGNADIGLGVCNTTEVCDFNQWQVDNNQPSTVPPITQDFVQFVFSGLVNITSVRIRQTTIVGDSDAVWATGGALTSVPAMLAVLTLSEAQDWTNPSLTFQNFNNRPVTINANGVQQLIFGTPLTDPDDLWKLYSIDVTVAPIPEPGSIALMGTGLMALGFLARRRRK